MTYKRIKWLRRGLTVSHLCFGFTLSLLFAILFNFGTLQTGDIALFTVMILLGCGVMWMANSACYHHPEFKYESELMDWLKETDMKNNINPTKDFLIVAIFTFIELALRSTALLLYLMPYVTSYLFEHVFSDVGVRSLMISLPAWFNYETIYMAYHIVNVELTDHANLGVIYALMGCIADIGLCWVCANFTLRLHAYHLTGKLTKKWRKLHAN